MRPNLENTLVLIPARANSKGVPKKNSKPFAGGKSLTVRAIETALSVFDKSKITLTTDDQELLSQTQQHGIFQIKRNEKLASDEAGMLEVMLDAIDRQSWKPSFLMLLQPTSPLRTKLHLQQALNLFEEGDQAVVAVNEPKGHPFYTLFQEENGYIHKFQKNTIVRRQDLTPMYDVNGLIYLFDVDELRKKSWIQFEKIRPMVVSIWQGIDIDTPEDWFIAEKIFIEK